jgi:RimJ/RimL family protein N-acetyltransferase
MTNVIQLREVMEADLPIFFEHQADPEATRMAAFPARDRDAFTAHWKKVLADRSVMIRTILLDGEVAGNVVCFSQSGMPLVGYWIGRSYWGRGIATRALAKFLAIVSARPLYALVAKHNLGSIRVLEKCGFKVCGEEKGPVLPDGEEVVDLIMRLGEDPASGR